MKTLVLDLVYLAKTYGMKGRVQFRLIEDPDTFRKVKLEMAELPADVAADLAAIQAIGTDIRYLTPEDGPEVMDALVEYARKKTIVPGVPDEHWEDLADRAYEEMFE